eukprot:4224445-Amphidinium_carterae.2
MLRRQVGRQAHGRDELHTKGRASGRIAGPLAGSMFMLGSLDAGVHVDEEVDATVLDTGVWPQKNGTIQAMTSMVYRDGLHEEGGSLDLRFNQGAVAKTEPLQVALAGLMQTSRAAEILILGQESRLVVQETRRSSGEMDVGEVFSATPPLGGAHQHCERGSHWITFGRSSSEEEEDAYGLLQKALNGVHDAVQAFEQRVKGLCIEAGARQGAFNPCTYYHPASRSGELKTL